MRPPASWAGYSPSKDTVGMRLCIRRCERASGDCDWDNSAMRCHGKSVKTMDFHWFSLIFNGFYWFSLIFIDFHWFLTIFTYCGDRAGVSGGHYGRVSGTWWRNTCAHMPPMPQDPPRRPGGRLRRPLLSSNRGYIHLSRKTYVLVSSLKNITI